MTISLVSHRERLGVQAGRILIDGAWRDEELTTHIVVTGTREEGGEKLVDLECSLANGAGEVKVAGSAVALAD